MKLIKLQCPSCGAHLEINTSQTVAYCSYCGQKMMIDDEVIRVRHEFADAKEAGYEFERGRMQAQEEARRVHRFEDRSKRSSQVYLHRRDVIVCVILTIVTCGLYDLYWMCSLNSDLNKVFDEISIGSGLLLILSFITCHFFNIYWCYKAGKALERYSDAYAHYSILFLLLSLFWLDFITHALIQDALNQLT